MYVLLCVEALHLQYPYTLTLTMIVSIYMSVEDDNGQRHHSTDLDV
jgi:hypothetical protein